MAQLSAQWSDLRVRLGRIALSPGRLDVFGSPGHRWILEAPISVEELHEIEAQLRVQLPNEYRSFLLEAGRGGAGPFYGISPLRNVGGRWDWDSEFLLTQLDRLGEPFPHTEAFNPLSLAPRRPRRDEFRSAQGFERALQSWCEKFDEIVYSPENTVGMLFLCDRGCAHRMALVVSGPARGQVWEDNTASLQGYKPVLDGDGKPMNFASWYRKWLAEAERDTEEGIQEGLSEDGGDADHDDGEGEAYY